MKQFIILITLTSAVVFLSIFLFGLDVQNEKYIASDDKIIELELSSGFNIETRKEAGGSILFGPVYKMISNSGSDFVDSTKIIYAGSNKEGIYLYFYNEDLLMWEKLSGNGTVIVNRVGDFSLGKDFSITAPSFLTAYDELLLKAPEGTAGFEMATSFSIDNEPRIMVNGSYGVGGCEGSIGRGNSWEQSLAGQDMRVILNDVNTDLHFSFVARWLVSDLGNCINGKDLEFRY